MGGGGGSLGPQPKAKRGKNSKRKKKKRVGFVLDMTPLVDIAFLLLTFFMFTTTMVTPQIMEMSVPPDVENQVEVKQSELFTILIRKDDSVFYYQGILEETQAQPVTMKALRTVCVEENMKQVNRLITALKADTLSSYGRLVQVLDVLNQAEADIVQKMAGQKRERKFTLAPVDPKELEAMKDL
jgi:biopolymer transport protein ExbD